MSVRQHPGRGDGVVVSDLGLVDIENIVGSKLMLEKLGLAKPVVVGGRYQVLRLLGRGARGLVCLANDLHLRREVALKLYPGAQSGSRANEVANEAQALARLEHPNIVKVYDFGDGSLTFEPEDIGALPGSAPVIVACFFMTMEFVRGESLRRTLGRGALSRSEVLAVFAQIGRGLSHAHAAGIVHRDFKPENVMLDEHGQARVVDFGLASNQPALHGRPRDRGPGTLVHWRAPEIVGTREYMAPEARVGHASAASDQFSFGVALYEALLGTPPPRTEAGLVYVDASRFPGALGRVLARALAFDPAHRYSNFDALLAELPSQWGDQWRWTTLDDEARAKDSRLWMVALGLGAAAAAVVLSFAWMGLRSWRERDDAPDTAEVAAERAPSLPERVGVCDEALVAGLRGSWQLRGLDLWDIRYQNRNVQGIYELEVGPPESGCVFEARLTKVGSENRDYDDPPTGTTKIEAQVFAGEVEFEGRWILQDRKDSFPIVFSLMLRDGALVGDYRRFINTGGRSRPLRIGPAFGARSNRPLPAVEGLVDVPCPSQCSVLCGGSQATVECQRTQCRTDDVEIVDCGPPSEDFIEPHSTGKWLFGGDWEPLRLESDWSRCAELRGLQQGVWRMHVRGEDGSTRSWSLTLYEPESRGAGPCSLAGVASSGTRLHPVVAEINSNGHLLVHDAAQPDALKWALMGWDFVRGSTGGAEPGVVIGYKR
ncbi:serine/threonine kinase family protein [Plesiocystis pacifica SIR-1]|uniref:Serine/threonine kinase family protein n=2 Tax=Plesiocystis pacifica TaxID=191768 RepID=A6FY30_9BACT|nr:serine/threonine kinase family protein [Plesiocystis pacifica SIR-1]